MAIQMPEHGASKDMPSPIISFIIPTLNEEVMLEKLLLSISLLNNPVAKEFIEIIVVDAHSTDNTVKLAKKHGAQVIFSEPGLASKSRNKGAEKASGEILAFIDADCELPANWLTNVLNAISNPHTAAVSAQMSPVSAEQSKVAKAWYQLAHNAASQQSSELVQWLPTFNLVVKKSTFRAAGGFNTSLVSCEDVDFSYRLKDVGHLVSLSTSKVIHHGESHTLRQFYRREAWRARGSLVVLRHHWRDPRELFSALLPFFFVASMFASALLLIASMQFLAARNDAWLILLTASLCCGPFLALAVARLKGARTSYLYCGILLIVYYFARAQGTLIPFKRVER